MAYTEPPDEDADIYTVEQFRRMCSGGSFIDYDGFGSPMKDGLVDESVTIKPSRLENIPADATHIDWYNR
jgi:hypothetical protein